MAAFAMMRCSSTLAVEDAERVLIRPNSWTMDPQASRVNGLTMEMLHDLGVDVSVALDYYQDSILAEGRAIAAYNVAFDTKVMRAELRLAGRPDLYEQTRTFCIMRASTGVCKIPKANGNGLKFPKLDEACAHWHIERRGAHTAGGDCGDALRVFRRLMEIGIDCTPKVQKAKGDSE